MAAKDLPGKADDPQKPDPKPDKPSGVPIPEDSPAQKPRAAARTLEDMVDDARDRYDAQTKWTVAALVAVGVLVYGSLPFTNALGQDLFDGFPICIGTGLVLAGLGIGVVVWARSRALEPQDASLGELLSTLKRLQKRVEKWPGPRPYWQPGKRPHLDPETRTKRFLERRRGVKYELYAILSGKEAGAHVGPGIEGTTAADRIEDLIRVIGVLEKKALRYTRDVAWDESQRSFTNTAIADLSKAVEARPETMAVQATWLYDHASLVERLVVVDGAVDARGLMGEVEAELDIYLAHRKLLLAESALAQIKGAFRVSRRLLLLGGVLTLFGAAIYTSSLPATPPDGAPPATLGPGTPLHVTFPPTTTRVGAQCLDVRALLVAPAQTPKAGNLEGPMTVFVTSPSPCTGQLGLDKGEAIVVLGP